MCHEPGNEVNVAAETVQLGHGHWAPLTASVTESSGKLRSAIQSVRALARFHLYKHTDHLKALRGRKAPECFPLRFNA
jgi:hypothetical protein